MSKFNLALFDAVLEAMSNAEQASRDAENTIVDVWCDFHKLYTSIPKSQDTDRGKVQKIAMKKSKISASTFDKRISMLNSALRKGLNPRKFKSFNAIEIAKGNVAKGTHKVGKTGTAVADVQGKAKFESEKAVIQAVNENELISLMAEAEFKKFRAFFDSKTYKLATVLKALKSDEAPLPSK